MASDKMAELKYVSSVVRALITSCKPPYLLSNLLMDYDKMEGSELPYRKLGYNSLNEFLVATGDFMFSNFPNGDVVITTKSTKSAHIVEMIKKQKPSRSTRKPKSFRKNNENIYNNQQRLPQKLNQPSFKASVKPKSNVYNFANCKKELLKMSSTKGELNQVRSSCPILGPKNNVTVQINRAYNEDDKYKDFIEFSKWKEMQNKSMHQQNNAQSSDPIKAVNKLGNSNKPENSILNQEGSRHVESEGDCKKAAQFSQWQVMQFLSSKIVSNNQESTNDYNFKQQQKVNLAKRLEINQVESTKGLSHSVDTESNYPKWSDIQNNNDKYFTKPSETECINNNASSIQISKGQNSFKQQKFQAEQQLPVVTQNKSIPVGPGPGPKPVTVFLKSPNSVNIQNRLTKYKVDRNITAFAEPNLNLRITFSLDDRLKIFNKNKLETLNNEGEFQVQQKVSSIKLLSDYCSLQGFSQPRYRIFREIYDKITYSCTVIVDDTTYSTYPQSYDTEYLAQEACSAHALALIKERNIKKSLPICSLSEVDFLNNLHKELLRHSHGVFAKKLPQLFGELFNQSLPDNWLTLLQASNKFLIDTISPTNIIIYANENNNNNENSNNQEMQKSEQQSAQQEQQQENQRQQSQETRDKQQLGKLQQRENQGLQSQEKQEKQEIQQLQEESIQNCNAIVKIENIILPWIDDCWKIYITHCVSPIEIWGCLLGDNYNKRLELLMNDINVNMHEKKISRPLSVNKNHFYLLYFTENWYRIQVKALDYVNNTALCFFIDIGITQWVPQNELYECKVEFLNVPPQAIKFCLYGLEDFENSPHVGKCLNKLLLDKEVVGKILTKAKDFYNNNAKIYTVLFDETISNNMTLNDHIINTIFDDMEVPDIKENILEKAIVTNISDDGDIYLQVRCEDFKYIQSVIERTVNTKLNIKQHNVTYKDLFASKLYLICDDDNQDDIKWYRGELIVNNQKQITNHPLSNDTLEMLFIDFGIKRHINISKIYLLENLSVVLKRFPRQAIKVRLYSTDNIKPKPITQLRRLLPINSTVFVKIFVAAAVPLVTIYARLREANVLCNINDALRMEIELEKSSNEINDHVNSDNDEDQITDDKYVNNIKIISPKLYNKLPKLQNYQSIPNINQSFGVRIAYSKSPSDFIMQPHEHYAALQQLMKDLQDYCRANDTEISVNDVEIGQAYAAKYLNGEYYRAIALEKYEDLVNMNYCDYGFTHLVTKGQMKILPNEFRQLPTMAIRAKLFSIKPINGIWTISDSDLFRALTNGKTLVSIVKKLHENGYGDTIVEVILVDVSTNVDFNIHEVFLIQKRAIRD